MMKKILSKINGHKKHAIPVLNIAVMLTVVGIGIKLLDRADAQSVERGEVKTLAIQAVNNSKENTLYIKQEVSDLRVTKLNADIFRLYTEQAAESGKRIEKGLGAIQATQIEQGKDIAGIKKQVTNLERVD